MPGTLYVVATPIGNLEDITLRALRVLREVAIVAAEDTRRTGNLLRHYKIDTPLLSLHEHNEHARTVQLLERMARGESVALVTDAGTPAVSDPGSAMVQAARQAGLKVEPVPGPSAVTAAVSVAGLQGSGFCFLGFPPIRSKDRKEWFARLLASSPLAAVFYEAPHKLETTLQELVTVLGERQIMLAREVTKIHEEFLFGTPAALLAEARAPRGEYTIVVPPVSGPPPDARSYTDAEIAELFGQITHEQASTKRDKARVLGESIGLSTKNIYEALERAKS